MNTPRRRNIAMLVMAISASVVAWKLDNVVAVAEAETPAADVSSTNTQIAHGRYLVHHVAKCIECHTPRDDRGRIIETRLLSGAPIPVTGPSYAQPWAAQSASITGLANYDVSFVRCLLTRGERPDGTHPKSPMPRFQLSDDDANDVIAYLRSI